MRSLRTLKKLLLGETWILPAGLALTLTTAGLLRPSANGDWAQLGGFILLGGVLLSLAASVNRSARNR